MSRIGIIVVGGGASGLVAAIAAARCGAQVTILERMDRIGKKILATGNGRCNLTNKNAGTSGFYGADPFFAKSVVKRFGVENTLSFFAGLGLVCIEEEQGRVYPLCGQASAALDVLRFEADRLGVSIEVNTHVKQIIPSQDGFSVRSADGRSFRAQRVIVSSGGKAAPSLGSDGSGLSLLQSLGHRIINPIPGLVPLNLSAPFLKQLDGVKFEGVATISTANVGQRSESGEILFTSYGVSGIPILQLSRTAGQLLHGKMRPQLVMNLLPSLNKTALQARLGQFPDRTIAVGLVGLLHKKIIPVVLRCARIDSGRPVREVTEKEKMLLMSILTEWTFPISGTQPWVRAQVMAGGVDTTHLNPRTMESRLIPGLYCCGEVVDIDGDCGGFNLQWAWSSGFVAGTSAAEHDTGTDSVAPETCRGIQR